MTIWRLWELGFSRDFPVREDSPSDASGSLTSNSKTQADSAIHSRRKAAKGEIRVTKRRRIVSRHGSKKTWVALTRTKESRPYASMATSS